MTPPDKTCLCCGRRITWRKKWERDWDQVRYCSQACRRRGVDHRDEDLEAVLRDLLARRPRGATVTDAELAAAAAGAAREGSVDGSGLAGSGLAGSGLEPARRAARRLHAAGEVEILQGGRAVDPSRARGPIDIRARR